MEQRRTPGTDWPLADNFLFRRKIKGMGFPESEDIPVLIFFETAITCLF
jgi:hypothetical protein